MNFKINPVLLILSATFGLVFTLSNCNNSGDNKKENTKQEVPVKDSSSNVAVNTIEPTIKTDSLIKPVPITDQPIDKPKNEQKITIPAVKEPLPPKNNTGPVVITNTKLNPVIKEPKIVKTIPEQPKVNNTNPANVVVEKKEEVKVIIPPKPPKEPEITKPVIEEEKKVVVPQPGTWIVPANANAKANPVKAEGESLNTGKTLYQTHCVSCHGKKGLGDGPKAAQLDTQTGSFARPGFQNQTDGAIFYKIREGRKDMPKFSKKLPDEDDTWNIVNFLRTLK